MTVAESVSTNVTATGSAAKHMETMEAKIIDGHTKVFFMMREKFGRDRTLSLVVDGRKDVFGLKTVEYEDSSEERPCSKGIVSSRRGMISVILVAKSVTSRLIQ